MAISMFDRAEVAAAMAERVPKLGGHIATMDLQPGLLANFKLIAVSLVPTGREIVSIEATRAAGITPITVIPDRTS
jgi:uncharacterized membrane protein YccF (DUF307 family)